MILIVRVWCWRKGSSLLTFYSLRNGLVGNSLMDLSKSFLICLSNIWRRCNIDYCRLIVLFCRYLFCLLKTAGNWMAGRRPLLRPVGVTWINLVGLTCKSLLNPGSPVLRIQAHPDPNCLAESVAENSHRKVYKFFWFFNNTIG